MAVRVRAMRLRDAVRANMLRWRAMLCLQSGYIEAERDAILWIYREIKSSR